MSKKLSDIPVIPKTPTEEDVTELKKMGWRWKGCFMSLGTQIRYLETDRWLKFKSNNFFKLLFVEPIAYEGDATWKKDLEDIRARIK